MRDRIRYIKKLWMRYGPLFMYLCIFIIIRNNLLIIFINNFMYGYKLFIYDQPFTSYIFINNSLSQKCPITKVPSLLKLQFDWTQV